MRKDERALRQAIIDACRWMNATGLNQGTSGNISARYRDVLLITPSATPYDAMTPDLIAAMPVAFDDGRFDGPLKPSTEWRFHIDIARARPETGAIVHAHSPHATALSIMRREIPACHYMIAAFGGNTVRCADYATFGTKALSMNALAALADRVACLLANHGMITAGATLEKALWLAVELETIARQYCIALSLGEPVLLSDAEIADAMRGFASYGLRCARGPKPRRRQRI